MNKKAQESILFDIYPAIIFFIIGAIFWLLLIKYETIQTNDVIQEVRNNIENEDTLISILKMKVDDVSLADSLTSAIITKDKSEFEDNLDYLLKEMYNDPVCWKFFVDEKAFTNPSCRTDSKDDLLGSVTVIPSGISGNRI